jgi:hypothetical protein
VPSTGIRGSPTRRSGRYPQPSLYPHPYRRQISGANPVMRHYCIEPKGVHATAQISKAGSTIPVENHDKPASKPCWASGRADETSSSGPIAKCNSACCGARAQLHEAIRLTGAGPAEATQAIGCPRPPPNHPRLSQHNTTARRMCPQSMNARPPSWPLRPVRSARPTTGIWRSRSPR